MRSSGTELGGHGVCDRAPEGGAAGARRACLRAIAGALALPFLGIGGADAARRRLVRHPARHAAHHPVHHPVHHPIRHHPAQARLRRVRPVIVIDPGHGGTDPGAVGRAGTIEKTVTLETALALRRVLAATGRYEVLLTRHDDRFVSLADRAAFGPAHDAALIISLHVDASPDRRARGASVYVRADGSSEAKFKRVTPGSPATIARALGTAPHPGPGSSWLQYAMIDSLNDDIQMTAAPARGAHLWVLASHGIPGVLVEMGFLSNRRDERLMRNPRHRSLIVRSLRDAVDDYFEGLAHPASSRT